MRFLFTPEEAQPIALAIADYFQQQRIAVRFEERGWREAPYRTTLIATDAGLSVFVEAQTKIQYGAALSNFARELRAQRRYAELYIASWADSDIPGSTLRNMTHEGVGWLMVDEDKRVTEQLPPRNWALVVTPDPTLTWGRRRFQVEAALAKFNEVNRKDGLRDLCELVEHEVEDVAILAVRMGRLKVPESAIASQDLSDQINTLSSPRACPSGSDPPVDSALKADLHSFREARNLVDHPARGKREARQRALRFHDKMTQGARLVSELESLRNRLRRASVRARGVRP